MNSKSSIFDSILNTIESEDIRKFAERCIETIPDYFCNELSDEEIEMIATTIDIANQKSGVAKTTATYNLAVAKILAL